MVRMLIEALTPAIGSEGEAPLSGATGPVVAAPAVHNSTAEAKCWN